MIVFNECRIDYEGKNLIIEASVDSLRYYDDIHISAIVIDTQDTFSESGPSSKDKAIYTQSLEDIDNDKDYIYIDDKCQCECHKDKGVKKLRIKLSSSDLRNISLNDNIFFVYIKASGIPSMNTPCGMDNGWTMSVAVNLRPIYNIAMGYIKELDNTCSIPRGFIDMILRLKAFNLSLKTGNYLTAIKQWQKFFKNKSTVSFTKNCGCYGIN